MAVQGEKAAGEVAAAIAGFNCLADGGRVPRPDVLIVARGGGSLEDLWAFNEEIVVRAAAASEIPLISAVGHETDFTLIDFVSDRRAPTPTAAAEMAVPVRSDLLTRINALTNRRLACWKRGIEQRRKELSLLSRALPAADDVLATPRQRLDGCAERLPRALRANAQIHHTQFSRVAGRLAPQLLRSNVERRRVRLDACTHRLGTALKTYRETQVNRITRARDRTTALGERSHRAMQALVAMRSVRLERSYQLLRAFSYQSVLERGFALVRHDGHPLRSAATVQPGMSLDIEFTDGRVSATANGVRDVGEAAPAPAPSVPAAWKPRKPKTSSGGSSGQGSLFG